MWRIETRRKLDDREFATVSALLHDAENHDGFQPLSDHLLLDLEHHDGENFVAVLAYGETGELDGYTQLSSANMSTAVELVIAPSKRAWADELTSQLLRVAMEVVAADGGRRINWWVHHPGDHTDVVAEGVGLRLGRRLLQMRRSLPIGERGTVDTRSFVIGRDEAEWLRVNNAAFRDHPEQGGWTIETLRRREAEPWFDPAGFRLHERDGKLAAFCWTKIHSDTEPPMGEIYVVAVDPTFHGHGLGKALTIAGLEHLAAKGLTTGMLHVDAANTTAMSLYERLGFTVHHADHAYVADITSTT
jgi:mycothiol synthase